MQTPQPTFAWAARSGGCPRPGFPSSLQDQTNPAVALAEDPSEQGGVQVMPRCVIRGRAFAKAEPAGSMRPRHLVAGVAVCCAHQDSAFLQTGLKLLSRTGPETKGIYV